MRARQRFVKDDDGHWYLINVGDEAAFDEWLKHEADPAPGVDWHGRDFDAYRIPGHPSRWTFEKPQIDL